MAIKLDFQGNLFEKVFLDQICLTVNTAIFSYYLEKAMIELKCL
jgi:hypothetical protein